MLGSDSAWRVWRSGLPRGRESREASSLTRLQAWSGFLDSDVRHTRRVALFALKLYDGLVHCKVITGEHARSRELLHAAAVVHEVGEQSKKIITTREQKRWWPALTIFLAGAVVKLRSLPELRATIEELCPEMGFSVTFLPGIDGPCCSCQVSCGWPNALDADHNGTIRGIRIFLFN